MPSGWFGGCLSLLLSWGGAQGVAMGGPPWAARPHANIRFILSVWIGGAALHDVAPIVHLQPPPTHFHYAFHVAPWGKYATVMHLGRCHRQLEKPNYTNHWQHIYEPSSNAFKHAASPRLQVLPDLRIRKSDDFTDDDVERWIQDAITFLKVSEAGQLAKAGPKKRRAIKKLYRLQSLHNARALDHMLRASTGHGLERFQITPPMVLGCMHTASMDDIEPLAPPILGVATDMGSSMLCWQYYLRYKSPVVSFHFPDTSHPANGNMLMALKHSGLWEACLLNKVVYKAFFGPFSSQAWAGQLWEAALLMGQASPLDEPIFQHFLPLILQDMREGPERAADPDFVQHVHDRVFSKEVAGEIGPALQFTRWGSIVDVGSGGTAGGTAGCACWSSWACIWAT